VSLQFLHVNETFTSLQGEGPSLGEYATFLRLARCNLACAWCDTRYSWDWSQFDEESESRATPVAEVIAQILGVAPLPALLVLTGGEPLLQQRALQPLLTGLREAAPSVRVEVESNGTIAASPSFEGSVHRFVLSPKLANSLLPQARRLRLPALRRFAAHSRTVLKFVLRNAGELEEVEGIRQAAGFGRERVWIMPEGASLGEQSERMASLADATIASGYNFTPRLHTLLWGAERSR
jgi:7-carboxy-7-deazaguanine synthase